MTEMVSCFKKYDIRGKWGEDINEDLAFKIGYSVAKRFNARKVVLGHDARESSPILSRAMSEGICAFGSDVSSIGLSGTEEMYAAVSSLEADAGVEVTASHNPIEFNGFKIVKSGSQPLTEKEFFDIKSMVIEFDYEKVEAAGTVFNDQEIARSLYIEKLLSFVNIKNLKPLKIVVNSGNGAAGPTIDKLIAVLEQKGVPVNIAKVHHHPDPKFPNGIPNPMLKENHKATKDAVLSEKADLGVAFDGDFDRCFIFDKFGDFVSNEYLIGFLAKGFLRKVKGAHIVHDPRVIWNILDVVENSCGKSFLSQTGHVLFKKEMRRCGAIYGGELSAHHYFRDFYYCDSGMIPWLMIWELLSTCGMRLDELISKRKKKFISSGEINFTVTDQEHCLSFINKSFARNALYVDKTDGVSISFDTWRFNLRKSNTEPLVRLNVEVQGDMRLLKEKTQKLKDLILKPIYI